MKTYLNPNEHCSPGPHEILYSHLSDLEMANKVRMVTRNDFEHEPIVQGARDRILHLSQRVEELERALIAKAEWCDEDQDLPEDDAIDAAHPLQTGDHKSYETALRLVGARRSKGALVGLVCWLVHDRDTHKKSLDMLYGEKFSARSYTALKSRAVAAEADAAAVRALMNCYNLGGWTDALEPMKRALAAEAQTVELREKLEAYSEQQERDPAGNIMAYRCGLCDAGAIPGEAVPHTAECLLSKMP
jgi:hypothetical protein